MEIQEYINNLCAKAKRASRILASYTSKQRNHMLMAIRSAILSHQDEILAENQKDIDACDKPAQFIDRLRLTTERLKDIAVGVSQVASLKEVVGKELDHYTNKDKLKIKKISVPLGVVGIIYEARPNVTIDTIALCIKSGNSIILRGSKDALNSNRALVKIVREAVVSIGLDPECVQLVEDVSHEAAAYLMHRREYIDVLVPRGSSKLIQSTLENSTIPVIETGSGKCHVYIEKTADIKMAMTILVNAKCQRTSVCNSCEGVLIDETLIDSVPTVLDALTQNGVIIHGDAATCKVYDKAFPATEEDYYKEYLGLEISCNIVSGVEEAIDRINQYGSHHSDAIITSDKNAVERFFQQVDSAAVYHNASTRFTDGFVFGFGAELGISTQKLHARGPLGLKELTTYKFVIEGVGQVRG